MTAPPRTTHRNRRLSVWIARVMTRVTSAAAVVESISATTALRALCVSLRANRRSKVVGRRSKVEDRKSKVEGRRSKIEGRNEEPGTRCPDFRQTMRTYRGGC